GRRAALAAKVLVRDIHRDEVAIKQGDDFLVGERTRSHGIGAASTAADGHPAIVGEQEYRPLVLVPQTECLADAGRPGDLVKTAFLLGRLPILKALGDPRRQLGVRLRLSSSCAKAEKRCYTSD